jgi:hypothetical protein
MMGFVDSHDRIDIKLGPGDATEASIPLTTLYDLKPGRSYPVSVTSTLTDGVILRSNTVSVQF